MSEHAEMERPVTYREFKHEITRIDERFDGIDRVLERVVDRLVALEDRVTTGFRAMDERFRALDERFRAMNERITTEARAAIEWGVAQIRSHDDKHKDLPPRVAKLEAKVFPPKRARRR